MSYSSESEADYGEYANYSDYDDYQYSSDDEYEQRMLLLETYTEQVIKLLTTNDYQIAENIMESFDNISKNVLQIILNEVYIFEDDYQTPLEYATIKRKTFLISWLLENDAYIENSIVENISNNDDIELLKIFIEHGANQNIFILYAFLNDNLKLVKYFVEKYGNYNINGNLNDRGLTGLMIALHYNYEDILDYLLLTDIVKLIDFNIRDYINNTVIYYLGNLKNPMYLQIMINNGANIYPEGSPDNPISNIRDINILNVYLLAGGLEFINRPDNSYRTPLYIKLLEYSYENNSEKQDEIANMIFNLLKNGASPNYFSEHMYIFEGINIPKLVLRIARTGDLKMLKLFLDNDMNPNFKTTNFEEKLLGTFILGNINDYRDNTNNFIDIIEILRKYGAIFETEDNDRIFSKIVKKYNDIEMIRFLLSLGFGRSTNYYLSEVIHVSNNYEILSLLIEYGANPDGMDDQDRETPLNSAITSYDSEDVIIDKIKILLEAGASVDKKGEFGDTPLYLALSKNFKFKVAQFLIDNGANVNNLNRKILMINEEYIIPTINFLLENGANINEPDRFNNILYDAIMDENLEIVEFLLEKGANPNIDFSNSYHETPFIMAYKRNSSIDIIRLLLRYGANPNIIGKIGLFLENISVDKLQLLFDYGAIIDHDDLLSIVDILKIKKYGVPDNFLPETSWFSILKLVLDNDDVTGKYFKDLFEISKSLKYLDVTEYLLKYRLKYRSWIKIDGGMIKNVIMMASAYLPFDEKTDYYRELFLLLEEDANYYMELLKLLCKYGGIVNNIQDGLSPLVESLMLYFRASNDGVSSIIRERVIEIIKILLNNGAKLRLNTTLKWWRDTINSERNKNPQAYMKIKKLLTKYNIKM